MPAVTARLPQLAAFMNSRRFDPRSAGIRTSFADAVMARSTTRRDVSQGQDGSERVDGARTPAQTQFMTLRRIAIGLSLVVALDLALAPSAAVAGGRVIVGRPIVSRPFVSHPFVQHPFVQRPFVARPFVQHHVFPHHFFRPFVPFGVLAPPIASYHSSRPHYSTPRYPDPSSYSSSSYHAAPPHYAPPAYAPPAYYDPAVSYAPPSR